MAFRSRRSGVDNAFDSNLIFPSMIELLQEYEGNPWWREERGNHGGW
jgi:hypothetical protein